MRRGKHALIQFQLVEKSAAESLLAVSQATLIYVNPIATLVHVLLVLGPQWFDVDVDTWIGSCLAVSSLQRLMMQDVRKNALKSVAVPSTSATSHVVLK